MNLDKQFEYKINHLLNEKLETLISTLTSMVKRGFLTTEQVLSKMESDGFSKEQIEAFKRSQDKLIY